MTPTGKSIFEKPSTFHLNRGGFKETLGSPVVQNETTFRYVEEQQQKTAFDQNKEMMNVDSGSSENGK